MRKYLGAAMAGLVIMASAAPAFAKPETVTGQVIDLYCYSRDKAATGWTTGTDGVRAGLHQVGRPAGGVVDGGRQGLQLAGALVAHNNAKWRRI
jgi:hypothetical protein